MIRIFAGTGSILRTPLTDLCTLTPHQLLETEAIIILT